MILSGIYSGDGLRHPDKRNTWVANKYWHSEGTRNWVFSTGKSRLKLFSDTKIVRCAGMKLDKNPYIECGAKRSIAEGTKTTLTYGTVARY